MNVVLRPELNRFVHERISSGEFSSESELVNEALEAMRREREEKMSPAYIAYVRAAIAQGDEAIRAGDVAPFDGKAILEKAHREHRERGHGTR